jgi:hypothetical protein
MLKSPQTLNSVRTCCHDVRTDGTLNCSKLLDTNGRPDGCYFTDARPDARQERADGILGSDFSDLESAQNLLEAF